MKNINSFSKYSSLENFALDRTEQFLRPRTFLDSVYLLVLFFWFLSATLFAFETGFRVTLFLVALGLYIAIPVYVRMATTEESKTSASSVNRAVKVLLFLLLIDLFTGGVVPTFPGIDILIAPLSYGDFERLVVSLMLPIAIFLRSFSLSTLQLGYDFYLGKILHGFWYSSLLVFIFRNINLFTTDLFVNPELFFLMGYVAFLLGNLLPGTPAQLSMSVSSILEQYSAMKTRSERFRDANLTGGLILLLILWLPSWIVVNRDLFSALALLGIMIAVILSLAPKEKSKTRFDSFLSTITGVSGGLDPSSHIASRVQNFAQDIKGVEFSKPEKIYTIPTDGFTLVSKGKTIVSAKQGTIAVPTVTEKGTALVLMGKSEMQTETANQETETKEIAGTTTVWLPPEEWEDVRVKLNPKDVDELTDTELNLAGLGDPTEIFKKAEKALNNLKQWRGPRGIFTSILDPTSSKYAIRETQDYSLVRLPGIYVFESKELEIVNILGGLVKVIEMKGVGSFVQILGGLVTVLDTKEYSFVQTPFVSVIDTPQGELVRVFGIDIQEGEKINLEEAREKIIRDQERFNSLFTQQVTSIFEEDPSIVLTELKGETKGWVLGEGELLVDSLPRRSQRKEKRKRAGKSKTRRKEHRRERGARGITITKPVGVQKGANTTIHETGVPQLSDEGLMQGEAIDEEILGINEALIRIEESIDKIDEKFLANEIDSEKHSEMIGRLKTREKRLLEKRRRFS